MSILYCTQVISCPQRIVLWSKLTAKYTFSYYTYNSQAPTTYYNCSNMQPDAKFWYITENQLQSTRKQLFRELSTTGTMQYLHIGTEVLFRQNLFADNM
jgi:hypothetical protein